ncbi:MAG: pseudouridine synthase [Blastocatellia bacterium]
MKSKQGQEWQVEMAEQGQRLDKWLAAPERLGSRSKSLLAIERGRVFVNDLEQSAADVARRVVSGERILVWHDSPGSATKRYFERHDSGLHLLYEDASLIVVNKPAGLLTVPLSTQPDEPSLQQQVAAHLRSAHRQSPLVVHRIDRDTSGVVVFAKQPAALVSLKAQFEDRQPERTYLAFVYGSPQQPSGTWQDLLVWDREERKQQAVTTALPERPGSKLDRHRAGRGSTKTSARGEAQTAICHYRVLERYGKVASLLEIRLVTGKQNQIRIQASLHGHPLLGEKIYTGEEGRRPLPIVGGSRIELTRQALHAQRLSFLHPTNGQKVRFEAPLPQDLVTLQQRLTLLSEPEAPREKVSDSPA